jgi:hypothetical protein
MLEGEGFEEDGFVCFDKNKKIFYIKPFRGVPKKPVRQIPGLQPVEKKQLKKPY